MSLTSHTLTVPRSSPHAQLLRARGYFPSGAWGTTERYEIDEALAHELQQLGPFSDPYPWPKRRWPVFAWTTGLAGFFVALVAVQLWGDEKQATAPAWSAYVIWTGIAMVLGATLTWVIASSASKRSAVPPWSPEELAAVEGGDPHAIPEGAPAPPPRMRAPGSAPEPPRSSSSPS